MIKAQLTKFAVSPKSKGDAGVQVLQDFGLNAAGLAEPLRRASAVLWQGTRR